MFCLCMSFSFPTSTVALMSVCSHLRILPPLLPSCLSALTFVSSILPPLLPSCLSALTFMSYLHCCQHVCLLSHSYPTSTVALMSFICL
jgi:hypothetical protein